MDSKSTTQLVAEELQRAERGGGVAGNDRHSSWDAKTEAPYGGGEPGAAWDDSGGANLLTQFWQSVRMTRPDGVGSVDPFGPVHCRPGPMTAAKRIEAMVYGEGNCRSDQQFWTDLEASMSRNSLTAVAGQQAEAIWNNRYQVGAILAAVMKGMAVAERSARRGNWKGLVATKLASGLGKLAAPAAVVCAVKEWLTAVDEVNGDATKLVYAQEKYAQVVLTCGLWLGSKLPGLWAKEGWVATETPRRVVIIPGKEVTAAGHEVVIADRAVATSGGNLTASGQALTKFTPPLAVSGAAITSGAIGEGMPPAQLPETNSIAASGSDIASYDPPTHKITLADGRELDERSTLVMWDGESWQLEAVKQAIARLRSVGDPVAGGATRIEVPVSAIALFSTPAGAAPHSNDAGNGITPQGNSLVPRRGLPRRKVSLGRENDKQKLIDQIRTTGKTEAFVFPTDIEFEHPRAVRATIEFFNDKARVASRLLQFEDEVIAQFKEAKDLHWEATVLAVLENLEKQNGFLNGSTISEEAGWRTIRLLFGAALTLEMAESPALFTTTPDHNGRPSAVFKQLVPVWDRVFSPTAGQEILRYFPELAPGYRLQPPAQRERPERIRAPSDADQITLPPRRPRLPIQIGGRTIVVFMTPPVREILETLVREYDADQIGEFSGYVPVAELENILRAWHSKTSTSDVIQQLRELLRLRDAGNIDYVVVDNIKGYRLRLSGATDTKRWSPVTIRGVQVWLYLLPHHLESLNDILETPSITRREIAARYRSRWESRHPGATMRHTNVVHILEGIDYALRHAKLSETESHGTIHVATLVKEGTVPQQGRGGKDLNVYRLEITESLSQPRSRTDEVRHSRRPNVPSSELYSINGRDVAIRLRPISHAVLKLFLRQTLADSATGAQTEVGYVETSEILKAAREEWRWLEQKPNSHIGKQPTNAKDVVKDVRNSLERAGLGTIFYSPPGGYQFQAWD